VPKTVAVISDAISDGFFFDLWYRYYGAQFGSKNLFVVTYLGKKRIFEKYELGGVIELPCSYDDQTRAGFISKFVSALLICYQSVVRVDLDEILVPDRRMAPSLAEYISNQELPYISARGFDLFCQADEGPLDLESPILIFQRKFAYGNSSLNKVCYTTFPVNWNSGFHGCSVAPKLDRLFLFHLKFVDIDLQLKWRGVVLDNLGESTKDVDFLRQYYRADHDRLAQYERGLRSRRVADGWDGLYDEEHVQNFYRKVKFDQRTGIYRFENFHDTKTVRIPDDFCGQF
jgi:hypothetical protein